MHITGIYAALATLLVLVLALRTSLGRHGKRISTGDGGDHDMSEERKDSLTGAGEVRSRAAPRKARGQARQRRAIWARIGAPTDG